MKKILTVTLNPAVDISADVDQLLPDRKLRCRAPHIDPGGGGVNVSRAIKILGGETTAFAAVGGPTGELLMRLLSEEGVKLVDFSIYGITRQSFSVLEAKTAKQYRFVLPGPEWSADMGSAAMKTICEEAANQDYIVISGSFPPGLPDDYAVLLVTALQKTSARIILDTSGPALSAILRMDAPELYCIRFNRIDAQASASYELSNAKETTRFAQDLIDQKKAKIIIVTQGANGAICASNRGSFQIVPPKVKTLSAVGAGDSFMAGLTFGMAKGFPLKKACGYAVAAATSAVTTPATSLCRRDDTERYFKMIEARDLATARN